MTTLPLRILLVLDDHLDGTEIVEALPAGSQVRRTRLPESLHPWPLVAEAAADAELVLVGCSDHSARVLELIEAAVTQLPQRPPVVVLHAGAPNGFMERAFEAGADDLIPLPQPPPQLAFALEKAIARRRGAAAPARAGEMITILGPKGGTGKTLTACNLAVTLAHERRSPVVIDLDLQFGDVGLALGLRPERTIYDLAVAGGTLDGEKIDDFLVRHETGAKVLLAPVRPDHAAAVSIVFLRTLFDSLRGQNEFLIVDTPPAFTPEVIAAIDSSSQLCMVGMLDALSLKDTKIGLQTLEQMGYDSGLVTLVLNRADSSVGISPADVERLLGRKPDVLVPSDRAIPRALTEGKTIIEDAPRSSAARAFKELAASFLEPSPTNGDRQRRRLSLSRKG